MKIHIESEEQNLRFWIPTNLVFSRGMAWLGSRYGLRYSNVSISPEDISRLFAEFRRIKDRYGAWELVNIESADGNQVKVIL